MEHNYAEVLELSNKMNEKAIRNAIKDLGLFDGAKVLDVPCGIGNHISYMLDENDKINITGIDFFKNHLDYARQLNEKKHPNANYNFQEGDINNLTLPDNSFDFIWCCDGLYPGPKEIGCLVEKPYDILKNFVRIAKNGAKIVVVFFTSKRLLSGYPLLEAALENIENPYMPFADKTDPSLHVLRTPSWFKKCGLTKVAVKSYAADLYNMDNDVVAFLPEFCNMFWGKSKESLNPELLQLYSDITNPKSDKCIFTKDYAGVFTYTAYIATVEK